MNTNTTADVTDAKQARLAEAAEIERAEQRITDLRARIETYAASLDEFAPDVVARALMVAGGALLLSVDGPFAARWAAGRLQDFLTGHWVPENLNSFIASYQK